MAATPGPNHTSIGASFASQTDPFLYRIHPDLYARFGPPRYDESGNELPSYHPQRAAWFEGTYSRVAGISGYHSHFPRTSAGLSPAEWALLVSATEPQADLRRLPPPPRYCDPEWHGPRHLPLRHQVGAVAPTAWADVVRPATVDLIAWLLLLGGYAAPGQEVEEGVLYPVTVSLRKLARAMGISHAAVLKRIRHAEPHVVVLHSTHPYQRDPDTGRREGAGRRGTPGSPACNPPNTYLVRVHPVALAQARELYAALGGQPEHAAEAGLDAALDQAEAAAQTAGTTTAQQAAAARAWLRAQQELRRQGLTRAAIQHRYGRLRAVAWDGRTLTLAGPVAPEALAFLKRNLAHLCWFDIRGD